MHSLPCVAILFLMLAPGCEAKDDDDGDDWSNDTAITAPPTPFDADADTVYSDDGTESARTSFCTTALDGSDCSAYTTGSNSFISGAMQFNYAATPAAMDITKGSSVVGIATSVTDLKGNAVGSVTYRVTIN